MKRVVSNTLTALSRKLHEPIHIVVHRVSSVLSNTYTVVFYNYLNVLMTLVTMYL